MTNREKIIKILKNIPKQKPEEPTGLTAGKHSLAIISKANFVAVALDDNNFEEIPKYEFMTSHELCKDTEFYINNNMIDEAQLCIELALRVENSEKENNWEVYFYAGFIALRQKIYDACVNLLNISLEYGCPRKSECFNYMAISYSILGETEDALKCYLSVIELESDNYEAWSHIGGFYCDNNIIGEAIKAYAKSLELKIDNFEVYEEIKNLSKQFKNKEINKIFKQALKNNSVITYEDIEKLKNWSQIF